MLSATFWGSESVLVAQEAGLSEDELSESPWPPKVKGEVNRILVRYSIVGMDTDKITAKNTTRNIADLLYRE